MTTATVTAKGQITIPQKIRQALGLDAGDRVDFIEVDEGKFLLQPTTQSISSLKGIIKSPHKIPVSIDDMKAAVTKKARGSL